MIKDFKLIANEDIFLEVVLDEGNAIIKFSDLLPYWSYATEDDFEGGFVKVVSDKLLFSLSTASMQGGIVVIWDSKTQKIEHISDGAYCISADLFDDKVYQLLCVANFVAKARFELWEVPFGVLDSSVEGTKLSVDIQDLADLFNGDVDLKVLNDCIEIKLNGKVYSFDKK